MKQVYRFSPLVRWITIVLAFLALGYGIFVVLTKLTDSSSYLSKLLPYAIVFLALNSLIKNFFTINTITLEDDFVEFSKLFGKSVNIRITTISAISLVDGRRRFIKIDYQQDGNNLSYKFSSGFPKIAEVLKKISDENSSIEFDEVLNGVILDFESK